MTTTTTTIVSDACSPSKYERLTTALKTARDALEFATAELDYIEAERVCCGRSSKSPDVRERHVACSNRLEAAYAAHDVAKRELEEFAIACAAQHSDLTGLLANFWRRWGERYCDDAESDTEYERGENLVKAAKALEVYNA